MPSKIIKPFENEILDIKKQSLYARLKKLFSTDVIVRNVGGKQLKIKDTDNIMQATDRNSLRDRFNRIRSTAYNAYTRDFSLSYQAARMDLFRDYDCVGPDTVIPLPDGTYPTIAELAEKYKDRPQERFYVFSYDHKTDSIKLGKAYHPRKKKGTRIGYKVTFDNGQYVIGSLKHPFLMRNGEYKMVYELRVGDSVMPFYQKDFYGHEYRHVYNFSHGWTPEHVLVAEQFGRLLNDGEVVHHKDFNKKNNLPDNLQIMTDSDHKQYHCKIIADKLWSPENKQKTLEKVRNSEGYKNRKFHMWNGARTGKNNPFFGKQHSVESNKTRSNTLKEVFANRDQSGEKNPKYMADLTFDNVKQVAFEYYKEYSKINLHEFIEHIHCDPSTLKNRLKNKGHNWASFKQEVESTLNHKIASIEILDQIEVYDVTVEEFHNFATDSCIVGNTMDMDPLLSTALDIYADECVHGDTIIPLLNGDKIRIDELFSRNLTNFWVYSLNENGEFRPQKCERVACNGVKPMYKVTLDDGTEIKCTSNHQWVTSNMELITTDKLQLGTSLKVIPTKLSSHKFMPGYSSEKEYRTSNNHRVVSVEFCGDHQSYDLVNVGDSTHLYAIETADGSKLFTHNCLTYNEMGKVLTIHSENNNVKQILDNLFTDILNIEFNMWSWTRNMCKYGDFYLKLYITPEYGIYMVEPVSSYNVERIENADPYNKRYVKFQLRPTDTAQAEVLENYEMAHFRLMSDSNFMPYGKSVIEGARRIWKQLSLLEDAMMIHRIVRAPEKRIFYTDIGNIPPAEVDTYMEKMMSKMKKVPYMDEQTGEYNLRYNLQNMLEDYYIPVRGGDSGTKIDTLGGMEWTGTEDVEYLRNKLLSALKIPKAFMGYDEDTGGKSTLASEDVRFARTIQRVQHTLVSELTKIAIIHLYSQGYRDESLVDFKLELTNPSTIFEKEKLEIWETKIGVSTDMIENKFFSYDWIYKNIFHMSDDDIKDVKEQIVDDSKQKYRFNSIEEDGDDPAQPFKKIEGDKGGGGEGEDDGDMGDIGGGGGHSGGMGGSDEPDLGDLDLGGGGGGGEGGEGGGLEDLVKETKEPDNRDRSERDQSERDQSGRHDARAQHPFGEDPLGDDGRKGVEKKNSEGKQKSKISHNYEHGTPLHLENKTRVDTSVINNLATFLTKTHKDTKNELISENKASNLKPMMDESNILE